MHVLVATAGALPPTPVVDLVERFLSGGGIVSVLSVIEVPRSFLDALREEMGWRPFDDDLDPTDWETLEVQRYVDERASKRCEPLVAAFAARGIPVEAVHREGGDPAEGILAEAEHRDVDLIVLGATRPIFSREAWDSVAMRVMHGTRRPVLVVPGHRTTEPHEDDEIAQRRRA